MDKLEGVSNRRQSGLSNLCPGIRIGDTQTACAAVVRCNLIAVLNIDVLYLYMKKSKTAAVQRLEAYTSVFDRCPSSSIRPHRAPPDRHRLLRP